MTSRSPGSVAAFVSVTSRDITPTTERSPHCLAGPAPNTRSNTGRILRCELRGLPAVLLAARSPTASFEAPCLFLARHRVITPGRCSGSPISSSCRNASHVASGTLPAGLTSVRARVPSSRSRDHARRHGPFWGQKQEAPPYPSMLPFAVQPSVSCISYRQALVRAFHG